MKLKLIVVVSMLALFAGAVTACDSSGFGAAAPSPQATAAQPIRQAAVVSAQAFVVPVKKADLAFEAEGRVASVAVEEGDGVAAGQVLVRLDDATQRAALAQAEAGLANAQAALAQAQAALAQTKAGSRPEEIAQAEAALAGAEAALDQSVAGPTKEDVAQATARLEAAQAGLDQVLAGAREEDKQSASARMLQAEAKVRLAQADYDKNIYGDPKIAEPFGVALQQATLDYEAAKAEYQKAVNGPTKEEVGIARAGVKEAQAALAKTKAGATAQQIAQAQAEVARAQAALAQAKAGATKEQVAMAEAGVQVAQAGVQSAEAGKESAETELAKTELKAPFAGTVGWLKVRQGEIVSPGVPVVTLGDVSTWQIETDDLTEIDVVGVKVGAPVKITVDALPGQDYAGKVVRIRPESETKAGDVTYTVLIDITQGDTARLRWGMTTAVDIEVGSGEK
jgi:HlyD family secretion protein